MPLLAVSAYTPQTINNLRHDFGSILRFIEQNYKLGTVGFADKRCDPSWANCAADNLRGFFTTAASPRAFTTIQSAHGAAYFINDKTPALDPDND